MDYMTIREASSKWGLGTRNITAYCSGGRIPGAVKRGNLWLIPQNAPKPGDRRRKEAVTGEQIRWAFGSLYENKELFAEIVRNFPYPMHICAPDGTMLLANEAFMEFAKITNTEKLYKKHNVLHSPNLERWGIKDFIERAFRGEQVFAYDVKVPLREIIENLGDGVELVCGSMFHNMTAFPIQDGKGKLLYIVFIFITSRFYRDKEEIIKGKEYIDSHWKEDFDVEKLTEYVHISRYHYDRLFKECCGLTPYAYYKNVKIEKLKEKLCETNLTIGAVFAECGLDYSGNFSRMFKKIVGMTPSEYRARMTEK